MDIPKSTVRFAQVVQESGRPDPVTLWTDPQKDSGFQAAMRQNRVMTVIQETVGTHKDLAIVGFHPVEHASYLVFPKSLGKFEGKRVVGIKYDLLDVPQAESGSSAQTTKKPLPKREQKDAKQPAKRPPPSAEPVEAKPQLHRFRVTVRSVAAVDDEREVEAKTPQEAKSLALEMGVREKPDFPTEKISRKVVSVRRI
jgi:hypothetical protein